MAEDMLSDKDRSAIECYLEYTRSGADEGSLFEFIKKNGCSYDGVKFCMHIAACGRKHVLSKLLHGERYYYYVLDDANQKVRKSSRSLSEIGIALGAYAGGK